MKVKIKTGIASGVVDCPPSKSMAHRLLICSALCDGESIVNGVSDCVDVSATLNCLNSLGIETESCGDIVKVKGKSVAKMLANDVLYCKESGIKLSIKLNLNIQLK